MKGKIKCLFVIMLLLTLVYPVTAYTSLDQGPSTPQIGVPCTAKEGETCIYNIMSIDPQEDNIYYEIRCSDDPPARIILGPYESGENVTFTHCWGCSLYQKANPFTLQVKAEDIYGHESEWAYFSINLTDSKIKNTYFIRTNSICFQFINLILHFTHYSNSLLPTTYYFTDYI